MKWVNTNLNTITEEEIKQQGKLEAWICCEECDYDAGLMPMSEAVFMINMQGGYFMYDGEGGAITKCPICGKDTLVIYN